MAITPKPISVAGLRGCYATKLAEKHRGRVVLAAEIRIGVGLEKSSPRWGLWFWVCDGRDGNNPTKRETQDLKIALGWYNQAD